MAMGEKTNETSFHRNPPPKIPGVILDGDGRFTPIREDGFGAEIGSLSDLSEDNVSNNADSQTVLTKPCCFRKV